MSALRPFLRSHQGARCDNFRDHRVGRHALAKVCKVTRFNVTYVTRDGLRMLFSANQGRLFHDTREDAEAWLEAFLENSSDDQRVAICGAQALGTFRVDAFDCYENGDAKGIYVDE